MTRGRSTLDWITPSDVATLPAGTPVSVETYGKHTARLVGRILGIDETGTLSLMTTRGEVDVHTTRVKRARLVDALYEPGDPVLKVNVSATTWRGGVVRTDGTEVLVEQLDGSFTWHTETDLEPPEARQPAPVAAVRAI